MRAQVCGPKRKTVASEADDDGDASPNGFAAAGMTGGVKMTGASLLVNLPPSMAPVPVWVGPTPSQAAIDAAYPPVPEKKGRKAASKKGGDKKDAAKQDATKQDAAKPDTAKKDASKKKPERHRRGHPGGDACRQAGCEAGGQARPQAGFRGPGSGAPSGELSKAARRFLYAGHGAENRSAPFAHHALAPARR